MNPIALGSRWLAYAENKVRLGPDVGQFWLTIIDTVDEYQL